MIRLILLGCLTAFLCAGQVVVRNHATGVVLASPTLLPDVGVDDVETIVLDVVNTGASSVTIQSAATTGLYFSLCCETGFVLQAGGSHSLTLTFAPLQTGYFSGALQIDGLAIFLFGRGLATPTLFVQSGPGAAQAHSGTPLILTESVPYSGQFACLLENNSATPVIVNALTSSGDWTLTGIPPLPLTLQPGQQAAFTLLGSTASSGTLAGVIHVDQQSYAIDAHPPTPGIHIHLSSGSLQSDQQASLSIDFDSAPAEALAGTVTLTFESAGSIQIADPAIIFTGSSGTSASFSSATGQLNANFAGQPSVTFQTGTTAGTLHVQATWGYSQDQVDIPLGPLPVAVESITATRSSKSIAVTVTGYDNTRTAGRFSFSFFDSSGAFIGSPVVADVTKMFSDYFYQSAAETGGVFKVTAQFPVTGGTGSIRGVQVDLMNTAGDTQTAVTPLH